MSKVKVELTFVDQSDKVKPTGKQVGLVEKVNVPPKDNGASADPSIRDFPLNIICLTVPLVLIRAIAAFCRNA